jgi:plastocyanin
MTVSNNVTPSISISSSANNICSNTSVTFTASISNGGSSPVYQWKKNGSNVGTNSSTYITSTLVNNDVITCELSSSLSCVTSQTAGSNSITMLVSTSIIPSVSITPSATTICSGTSTTLTATGGVSYAWSPATGLSVATGDTVTASPTSTTTYTVTGTSSAGCTATNTVAITVNQTPIVAGGATNSTLCLGDSTNFGLTAGTSATFTFVENGNVIGTSTNPISFYVTPSSSTNIGVYSTANGCSSDTLNIALTVNLPSSSNETQTACDSYQWNGQTYTSSGVYTYTTQNAVGCDSVVTLNLTINNSSSFTDVHTACDLFTWIDGITYTSSTNNPTFTLTNAAGCDSVITLNLTINYRNT